MKRRRKLGQQTFRVRKRRQTRGGWETEGEEGANVKVRAYKGQKTFQKEWPRREGREGRAEDEGEV